MFIEDYDINVCRHLIQGVDVWLNNPRRPLEASGTSGQKVVLNGGLNCSILDGWWAEAYDGDQWLCHRHGEPATCRTRSATARDGESLYRVLEEEVMPLFYDRDIDGLPRRWVQMMMNSIGSLGLAVQLAPHGDGLHPYAATSRLPADSAAKPNGVEAWDRHPACL